MHARTYSSVRCLVVAALLLVGTATTVTATTAVTAPTPVGAVTTPTLEAFQPETLAINAETDPLRSSYLRATLVIAHPADWNVYQFRYSRRTAVEGVGSYVNVDANRVRTIGIGNGSNYSIFEAEIPMSTFSNWGFSGTVRWIDNVARVDVRMRQGTSSTFVDLENNTWTYQAMTETQSSGQEDPATLYDLFDSSRNANLGNGGQFRIHYRCDDNDSSGNNDNCDHGYIRVRSLNSGIWPATGSIQQMSCGSGVAASAPCEGSNSPGAFNADDGSDRNFLITHDPAWGRGRWVIEGKFCGEDQRGNINNCVHGGAWQNIGSYYVNDGQTAPTFGTPTFSGGGNTVGGILRPNTGASVSYPLTASDGQVAAWDLNNDGTADAWDYAEGSSNGQPLLTTGQKTRTIDTSAMSAGSSCRIRVQVTDNGGINAADPTRNTSSQVTGPDCRVNTPPAGANQGPLTATKGTGLAIALANTDTVDGDARTCEQVSGPGKGTLTGFTSCSVTYTASANQYGSDSFTYRVRDDHNGVSATYTVSLAIQNRAPTATPQSVTVDAGAPTAITLAGTDLDSDTPLTCATTTSPGKGGLTGSGCARSYTSNTGTANAGVGGSDSFGFTVADGAATSGAATVGITIANPDLSLTKSHTGRFNEGTGTGTYTLTVANTTSAPANGTTTLTDTLPAGMIYRSSSVGSSGFSCSATPGVSTTVTCTRSTAIAEGASLSLTITVDVAAGASSPLTNQAVVSSLYELASTAADNAASDPTDVNHRPSGADGSASTDVDAPVLVTLAGTDPDGDALTFAVVAGPTSGSLFGSGANRQYVPNTGFTGVDTFTYSVTDTGTPGLTSATYTVTIHVGVSRLTGVVTDEVSGSPVAGVEARLVDMADPQAGVLVATVATNGSGAYDFGPVAFGTYGVRFVDPSNDHISEWYDDAPTSATANLFTLDTSATTVTRSVALRPGGRITGTVRSTEVPNAPIEGLQVRLVKIGSTGSQAKTTSASGGYAFELLQPGSYQLWFRDLASGQWISEWYGNVATQGESTTIELAVGQQTVIDEQITPVAPPPPPDSGSVTGTVTDSVSGAPLAGVQVRLYKDPYTGSASTTTDANGQYAFTRLAPATYKLWFRDMTGTRVSEYGGDASTLAEADTLTMANDGHIVNATLAPKVVAPPPNSGVISGTVLEVDGFTPIVGLQVRLYAVGGTGSKAITTDANGGYSFAGLAPGQYQVFFRDLGRTWFSEWHLDAATQAASTPVAAVNGQTTDVDATLNRR